AIRPRGHRAGERARRRRRLTFAMPVDEPLYPVNLRLRGQRCLVVGGGRVALGKILGLIEAGAAVTVVAPDVIPEIEELDGVEIVRRTYTLGEVAGYRVAIAATGDGVTNRQVHDDGDAARVWVNAGDAADNCTFTLPTSIC